MKTMDLIARSPSQAAVNANAERSKSFTSHIPLLQDTSSLDCLPYAQNEETVREFAPIIDNLIITETTKMPEGVGKYAAMVSHAADIDEDKIFASDKFLLKELQRIERGDFYQTPHPIPSVAGSLSTTSAKDGHWAELSNKLAALVETNNRALENIRNVQQQEAKEWKIANESLQVALENMKEIKCELETKITEINGARRADHHALNEELQALDEKFKLLVRENTNTFRALEKLNALKGA